MDLLDTRADTVLNHNEKCCSCPHAKNCLGGCRASALETTPKDILGIDTAACTLFCEGWPERIHERMQQIRPGIKSNG
jgi:hypothetical protein